MRTAPEMVAGTIEEGEQWALAGYTPLVALSLPWLQNALAM